MTTKPFESDVQFGELKEYVRNEQPTSEFMCWVAIQKYFDTITWSLLKEEWDNLSIGGRQKVSKKMYRQFKEGTL